MPGGTTRREPAPDDDPGAEHAPNLPPEGRSRSRGDLGRGAFPRTIPKEVRNAGFLAGLPLFSFDLIMADPPWLFRTRSLNGLRKSPQAHYRCMSIEEIAALPIAWLAAPHSVIFLWGTWPLLIGGDERGRKPGNAHRSPIGRILDAWSFRYVTGGAWAKRTKTGKPTFGGGYRIRSSCEPFLIGVKGSPLNSRTERNLIETVEADNLVDGLRREHSRKPDDAYAWCERYLPGARRLDLFSRTDRPGWTAAGDEIGKFNREILPRAAGEGDHAQHGGRGNS